jgi:tetratricopeptide (TPR) repeat protein
MARQGWRRTALVLAVFVAVFVTSAVVSLRQKSATWDEPIHLTAGYVALTQFDYRLEPTHPPFLRMWAALPLLAMSGVRADSSQIPTEPAERLSAGYGFAYRFLYQNHDADRLLYSARYMSVAWGVLLGVLIFLWAREWLGFAAATVALAFYTFEPNIAAHSRLVTTDAGVSCFIFGAVYCLWRTCRKPTASSVAGAALFTTLAVVSKFSAILLGPIVLLLLAAAAVLRAPIRLRVAAGLVVLLAVCSVAGIWAVYGFRFAAAPQDGLLLEQHFPVIRERAPVLANVTAWVDQNRLLPNAFTQGFLLSQATSNLSAYLAGNISNQGWWYYFPVAFLVKTPSALILLFLTGIVLLVARRFGTLEAAFVAIPIVVYSGFAIASGINIGLRHILPVYPFVVLIAAAAAKELLRWHRRAGRVVLASLMAFWFLTFAWVYPHTLTFFNVFAGGPGNGLTYLADSNLDWGQDLKSLKTWMDEKKLGHLNLSYFGTASPEYYNIACTHLPGAPFFASEAVAKPVLPGYVAISATNLSGVYLPPEWRLFYSGFLNETPVATIGNSIRVYWVERWPDSANTPAAAALWAGAPEAHMSLADALLFGLRWPELAVRHYQKVLDRAPDDRSALAKAGVAFLESGDNGRAIGALRRAAGAGPEDGQLHTYLATALLRDRQVAEAEEHARAAIRLQPDDPVAHDILGVALAVTERFDDAVASFRQALALAPGYEDARIHLERLQQYRQ